MAGLRVCLFQFTLSQFHWMRLDGCWMGEDLPSYGNSEPIRQGLPWEAAAIGAERLPEAS